MTKKNIRTAKRWAFPIVAGAFAILQITKGEILLALWVSMAGTFNWIANVVEERCEDLENDVENLIKANHDIAEALKKEQAKNAELQEEITKLKQ